MTACSIPSFTNSLFLDRDHPDLGGYEWSSFRYFVGRRRDLGKWLTPSRVFGSMGLEDTAAGRRAFRGPSIAQRWLWNGRLQRRRGEGRGAIVRNRCQRRSGGHLRAA